MKRTAVFICFLCCLGLPAIAQPLLPEISVINNNGRVVVSWKNNLAKPATTLNIQRSYDSLRHFTTIGTVLAPQSEENGYLDENPPYGRMYYRVFIAFEGGAYIIGKPVKAIRVFDEPMDSALADKPWMQPQRNDPNVIYTPVETPPVTTAPGKKAWMPSTFVFTARDNSIILNLPGASSKNYKAKFFDDRENPVFELNNLKEELLIMDKMNFPHSGWFFFELFNGEVLVERNKFFVPKDTKVTR